ncbi:MAG TPA: zinc ribbon domain-containing protein [Blastocatellia bacterium]|nr:zinc ribbon domain-containing protein [Blastocatellia bacterium]
MFCPQCGNQPASKSARFCPGCGFRLDGTVGLLVGNDASAGEGSKPERHPSMVRRGAMLGITLMLIANVLFGFAIGRHDGEGLVFGSIFVWVGLMILINLFGPVARLARKIFSEEEPALAVKTPQSRQLPLPPAQSAPVAYVPPQRTTTSKIVQQASVTEQTTGLLKDK